ncbi:hypothetical protein [Marivita sp. GX14005]|uniref:hypothetical protein n=1 Tax=Marivita sp. GX14005 TaxID=2942276 RepID=UPI00201A069A|nr:hypothetical protein [Marivita sp. GX14005]
MTVHLAHFYATACLAIVFFQIALIAGAPLGAYTQGGRYEGVLPLGGRLIAALSIPVLVFMALAILSAAGFPGLGWPRWTGWLASGVQLVSALLNTITPSRRERAVWAPITWVLAALCLAVMTA